MYELRVLNHIVSNKMIINWLINMLYQDHFLFRKSKQHFIVMIVFGCLMRIDTSIC